MPPVPFVIGFLAIFANDFLDRQTTTSLARSTLMALRRAWHGTRKWADMRRFIQTAPFCGLEVFAKDPSMRHQLQRQEVKFNKGVANADDLPTFLGGSYHVASAVPLGPVSYPFADRAVF